MLKNISASEIFEEYPEIEEELWDGEFWEDEYFARTVRDVETRTLSRVHGSDCYQRYSPVVHKE